VSRGSSPGAARGLDRYLRHFGEIRRIQDYLVARAERVGVPVIDGTDGDEALRAVLDLILQRATAAPGAVP
jgi:2-phosphoglycerate kinase